MLMSPFKEIEALRSERLTTQPRDCEKIVVIDGMVVVRLKRGKWWTNWAHFRKYAYMPGSWNGRVPHLLKALVSLGIISQEIVDKHLKVSKDADARADLKSDVARIEQLIQSRGKEWVASVARHTKTRTKP
jgi:hypothetical protein